MRKLLFSVTDEIETHLFYDSGDFECVRASNIGQIGRLTFKGSWRWSEKAAAIQVKSETGTKWYSMSDSDIRDAYAAFLLGTLTT